ncbi:MAG TPA: hypothetical protein VIM12_15115 [Noviherbaspirillum sp.]|jgi:hypothetical protein|uniref:hypothetical protein n=1 Tax=Noviherbaspirillum sp. TaxID=1926288 RepID=UPI002F928CE9
MKTALAIALSFASLVLLLDVDASSVRGAATAAPVADSAAAGHVGEGANQPL